MKNKSLLLPLVVLALCVIVIVSAAVAVVGVVMGWWSLFGVEHPKRELARLEARYGDEVREWQAFHEAARQYRRERLETARAALPVDAPITPDWECNSAVLGLGTQFDRDLLGELCSAYLNNPDDMFHGRSGNLKDKLDSLRQFQDRLTPLERRFAEVSTDPCEVRKRFEDELIRLPSLIKTEFALAHDVIDSPDSEESCAQAQLMRLMAARALVCAKRGEVDRAVQMLIGLYDLEIQLRDAAESDRVHCAQLICRNADRALMRLLPEVQLTPEQRQQIEQRLVVAVDDVARILCVAGCMPSGYWIGNQGQPLPVNQNDAVLIQYSIARDLADAYARAPREFAEHLHAVDAQLDERPEFDVFQLVTSGFTTLFGEMAARDVWVLARVLADLPSRSALVALAQRLEAVRTQHGVYPENLDSVETGDLELYSYAYGEPVQYVRDGVGYRLEVPNAKGHEVVWAVPSIKACDDGTAAPTETPG